MDALGDDLALELGERSECFRSANPGSSEYRMAPTASATYAGASFTAATITVTVAELESTWPSVAV